MSAFTHFFQSKINNSSRMHIFLDLDNTIINALSPEELKILHKKKIKPEQYLKYHDYKEDKTLIYRIFERPNLQIFLNYLFTNFEVSVFTAAMNDYAAFIVKHIIIGKHRNRKIKYFFYNYHSEITYDNMNGLKDLNLLWSIYKIPDLNSKNTIIIDDNDEVYQTNKNNCIKCPPFQIINDDQKFTPEYSIYDNYLLSTAIEQIKSKLLH